MNLACASCQACMMEYIGDVGKATEAHWCKECGSLLLMTPGPFNRPDKYIWRRPLRYQDQPARPLPTE